MHKTSRKNLTGKNSNSDPPTSFLPAARGRIKEGDYFAVFEIFVVK
jgi:hypothetical protein